MTLAETQALFHQALTRPESVSSASLEACFAGTPELGAVDRVAIYQDMYLWRLAEALREVFPQVARAVGDERFLALARDYLARHPSEHHDIGLVGRQLAGFLSEFPDPDRPDLADLAALEWARHQVFFEAPSAPAGPEALADLGPEAFARTALALAPALRLLELEHAVVPLWRQLEEGGPLEPPRPGPSAVAVWRTGHEVFHAALPADEAAALGRALAGLGLAEICAAFAEREAPAVAAHAALSSWLEEGWITGTRG